jgi:arylsulfatase A-like enzyme
VKEFSGGREKKGSVYEGGLRVPSIIEYPSEFEPTRISAPTSSSDIYPTLLALTKTEVENQLPLDGINLLPFLKGKENKRPKPIGFWHNFSGGQSTRSDQIIKKLMEAQQGGEPNPFPERVFKNVNNFPKYTASSHQSGHAALLDWPFKIHAIFSKKKTTWELYDLSRDPTESNTLNEQEPKQFFKMQKQLTAWQKSVLESHSGHDLKN